MATGAGVAVGLSAGEFVNELEHGIVARIADHLLAFGRRREYNALMRKAPKRGVLDRQGVAPEGINLHHPAEGVWLVAIVLGRAFRLREALKRTKASSPVVSMVIQSSSLAGRPVETFQLLLRVKALSASSQ